MVGKILGLGFLTLLAFAAWVGAAAAALFMGRSALPESFALPGYLLPWSLRFTIPIKDRGGLQDG